MLPNVKKAKATIGILAVFSALTLSACSGGGGGGGSSASSGSSATELKPGVYDIGRLFSNGSTKEGLSLISPTGKFVANLDSKSFTFGNIVFSASGTISGAVVEYILGPPWELTNGTLSGQVVSSEEANLGAQNGNLSTNSVLLRKPEFSDSSTSFEKMDATYFMSDPSDTAAITIAPDGSLEGTDQLDCTFSGQIVIPDKNINVFEVTYTASLCAEDPDEQALPDDRNGEFSGLGFLSPSGDEIIFYSRNGKVAWMFKGTR
tara:strand:- start:942 stop:1727 length:786 start_codon:yes stop_codon:yes gene_type:complete